jgi:hypothetical protein
MMMLDCSDGKGVGSADVTATAIRSLNDAFRRDLCQGRVMMSAGVRTLDGEALRRLLIAIRSFDNFDPGNDPYNEHDFGAVEIDGITYFWKIDYYDLDLQHGSPDPSDPNVTSRVLTIMRADEY